MFHIGRETRTPVNVNRVYHPLDKRIPQHVFFQGTVIKIRDFPHEFPNQIEVPCRQRSYILHYYRLDENSSHQD